MDIIKDIIGELSSIDKNWLTYLSTDKNINDDQNPELLLKISKLLAALKNLYKKDKKNCLEQIDVLFEDKLGAETIKKYLNRILIYYQNTEHIRELEKADNDSCKKFIKLIMENYTVRISKTINENFAVYHFKNDKQFLEAARALDSLTEYYVKKAFAAPDIVTDFQDETDLSESTCQFYADLVNQYYSDIRFNIIMNNTEFLCSHIERTINTNKHF